MRIGILGACIALLCIPAARAADPALALYGELPSFSMLEISPDGTRLAYAGSVGDQRHVIVKSFSDGRKLADFTTNAGQKLRALQWADNDHLLAILSMTTAVSLWGGEWGEYAGVIAVDVTSGKAWDVLEYPGGRGGQCRSRHVDNGPRPRAPV